MINEKISLSEKHPDARLTAYIHPKSEEDGVKPRTAVIVCPGGGYGNLSDREKVTVEVVFGEGYNSYLLDYSVKEKAHGFAPLIQAALAIKYVREMSSEHNTDPDRIFILGFSAGGHLAASAGILWNAKPVRDALGITSGRLPEGINKPTGAILCYPVISGGDYRHNGSFTNLCGKPDHTQEERDVFSLEKHVDGTSAPAFVWHTMTDKAVPVQNTLLLIEAYGANARPIEAHIYPEGNHGLGLCTEKTASKPEHIRPDVASWFGLAMDWMRYLKT